MGNVKEYKGYKYNSQEVMRMIQDVKNPIGEYLTQIISNNYNYYYADIERTKLHKKIIEYFGYDTDNKEHYYRSKHLLSNIRRMLAYPLGYLGVYEMNKFDIMITTGTVNQKEIKTFVALMTGFMMLPTTRAFMDDKLDAINDMSIWDLVFVEPHRGLHNYYHKP